LVDGRLLAIDEISGILDHSDECNSQIEMERDPRLPLHQELREYALGLLRKNTPLSLLRAECSAWAEQKWPGSAGNNFARHKLTTHDTSSLYRTISRERGIPQRTAAEDNLDLWFRKEKSQPPSPLLTEACLHYQAHRFPETDRFEIILSTPEMRAAAWKFGHQKQALMDLTFGVCSARALLAILMVIDDSGTGIPIAFMLFTARPSAKAVHADYDTAELDHLLSLFKKGMGVNECGEAFDIRIGSTDNDPRERSALTKNWSNILLLLCIFHIWQSWKNGLNRYLRCIPKGNERQAVRKRLGALLARLVKDITDHDEALTAYHSEIKYWESIAQKRNTSSKAQAKGALSFLVYLKTYVENRSFWMSWSPAGAIEAARRLGVPVSRIARTTNHLESFNGRIKGKYLKPFQHSGRLPRIDTWILIIVTAVMPDFFKERRDRIQLKNLYTGLRVLDPSTPTHSGLSESTMSQEFSLSTLSPAESIENPADSQILEWLKDLENNADDGDNEPPISGDDELSSSIHSASDCESHPNGSLNSHPLLEEDPLPTFNQDIFIREEVSTSMVFDESSIPAISNPFLNVRHLLCQGLIY